MKTKLTPCLLAALPGAAQLRRHILPILLIWVVGVCNSKATLYSVELIDNDGPHITGVVDTTTDTFTILTWIENPGGTAFWSANDLPRTYQARDFNGNAYDVPDNWNGTMSGWGFLNPNNYYHSGWNEGTGTDAYLFDGWGIGQVQSSYSTGGASVWNMMPVSSSSFATANFDSVIVVLAGSDDCTNAPVVGEGTYSGNTASASNDGTASCGNSATSPDVWFIYQAGSDGVANARTGPGLGTDFDTVLAVFDGCGGNEIIANDDAYNSAESGISEVSWVVTAGQKYWIRVAGYSGATGNYGLEIRDDPEPINDDCATALPVVDGSYVGTTVGTTAEGTLDCQNPETHDVWFVYTNQDDCARDVTFSTCNGITDFDTVLRAYDGCGGNLLALNDDGCSGPNSGASTLTLTVAPWASVWIRLNGFASATGNYQLDVSSVYNSATFCAANQLHWPLEEGSGTNTTESVSGETNVAHLMGDATWTNGIAPGSSHAVHFSNAGTGWIDAGTLTTNGTYVAGMDPAYQSLTNQWTITAWVNLDNPQSTTGRRELIGSASGVTNWWDFGVQDWAGTPAALQFDFRTVPVFAKFGVPLGKPVFIAVIANKAGLGSVTNLHRFAMWDGAKWSIEDGTAFAPLGLAVNLGTWQDGLSKFDGAVDDVRIYDIALTQTELAILASQPPALAIAPVGLGSNSISWTPAVPGYVLQETPSLAPAAWSNSVSGATNPINVPATNTATFYRLHKP